MSERPDQSMPSLAETTRSETPRKRSIQADDVTRLVQLGAAVLLGGGFYYGFTKQQRVAAKVAAADARRAAKGIKPKEPVARAHRPPTIFEKQLGLDRPRSAGSAAFRALLGGTIAALTGAAVVSLGVGAALGARNPTEFRDRMEDSLPRLRDNVVRSIGIQPKPIESAFGSEDAELEHISQIFEDAMRLDAEAERKREEQKTAKAESRMRR